MPRYDQPWLKAHAGKTTVRRFSSALRGIAKDLGRAADETALGKMARRRDPFWVLVACLISLRTKDEVTDEVAPRLLKVAPTPKKLMALEAKRIEKLIFPAGFYRTKAKTLREISRTIVEQHNGHVPRDLDTLLTLKGVGRKTANLVVTLGFREPGICVDTHVHRMSNRLGFVRTDTPDDTEQVLRDRLPAKWWIPINDLMVAFGRTICAPLSPHCSTCPVAKLCPRVGVGRTR